MNEPAHDTCGCCEGVTRLTPRLIANRPGLSALSYRVGTHAAFLQTMLARLSNIYLNIPRAELKADSTLEFDQVYPLAGLTTRAADDPAIALLDAWAIVADVLTFYQERIANEGYLRTATERHSILELARLVGYALRPGVASTVYLAYTIDSNQQEPVEILPGARAQSVPGPDELPQSFETIEKLVAAARWNNLRPRLTQPQTAATILTPPSAQPRIYLKGITTNLKPNDPLLIGFTANAKPELFRVIDLQPDPLADRTLALILPWGAPIPVAPIVEQRPDDDLSKVLSKLTLRGSIPPRNALQLARSVEQSFGVSVNAQSTGSSIANGGDNLKVLSPDTSLQLIAAFQPDLARTLPAAVPNVRVTADSGVKVYALRLKAAPFGHNAPKRVLEIDRATGQIISVGDWPIIEEPKQDSDGNGGVSITAALSGRIEHEQETTIYLDASYDKILPNSWIVIETSETRLTNPALIISHARNPKANISRAEYGISGNTTRIGLDEQWIFLKDKPASAQEDDDFDALRGATVYAQSEELPLAEEPIAIPICGGADDLIELDDLYAGLQSGRWLIVTGERDDIKDAAGQTVKGVKSSELVMLSEVIHAYRPGLPGDVTHTFIRLAKKLEYCFGRDKVTIYGNVVKATHGETREETLGSGDGARPLQAFTLRQPPLTFVAAPTPAGAESTLKVYVNSVEWHEVDALAGLGPTDRRFITRTDNDDKTTLTFGNGMRGARLPTGVENVKAIYRNGIGKPGNVRAEQISLLMTRPLGVKDVINPLRASGGADRESQDQARSNAPLALMALDRLVSVQDYADFARTFAGVGKALAQRLSNGRRELVFVTIAGAGNTPIDETSDLYRNLRLALRQYGDPDQPFQIIIRELLMLVISANVKLLPDYPWEPVAKAIRVKLLDSFSFERRELGQDVLLSEVFSAIQAVEGVAYVDIDVLGGIPEKKADGNTRRQQTPNEIVDAVRKMLPENGEKKAPKQRVRVNLADFDGETLQPAQLAFLTPDVPDTLILNPA